MNERDYQIAVSAFTSFGPVRTKLLLKYFKSAKNIWNANKTDFLETGLKENLVNKFLDHVKNFDFIKFSENLKKEEIKVFTINDKNYPQNLKEIADAPYVIYVKGEVKKEDRRAIAIVGTRLMTSYGREIAEKFARDLANTGITVVSGLALGIDAAAQRSALKSGGRTISVLASGLDIISPLTNKALALEFIKNSGAVVSEYPPAHVPFPGDFPVRDRLISGLSKGVIVIEGRMKSGTFYTVKAALDQGRPVFAVPGQITSPASEGPNYLIQNGAKLITGVRDVLEELNMQFKVDNRAVNRVMPDSPIEVKLLSILAAEPLHLDEVVRIAGVKTPEISARLTIMEMKGLVKNIGDGVYKKV